MVNDGVAGWCEFALQCLGASCSDDLALVDDRQPRSRAVCLFKVRHVQGNGLACLVRSSNATLAECSAGGSAPAFAELDFSVNPAAALQAGLSASDSRKLNGS
jgi:hypothetical protein